LRAGRALISLLSLPVHPDLDGDEIVAVVVAGLGWPAAGGAALLVVAAAVAGLGCAVARGLGRMTRARAYGVFRVRRVL
jgi:hypothetical protein